MPEAVPGAAVSPGISSWSLFAAPALTVVDGEVLRVMPPLVASVAVTVFEPAVLNVTLNVWVPAASAAFDGSVAFASELVIAIVSVEEATFQFASTSLTVTENCVPAVWADGVPVLPLAVPGAAVSPGIRSCNLFAAPAFTVVDAPTFAVSGLPFVSVAVTVREPDVLNVTENVCVPAASAAFDGSVAFASLDVIATVCVTVLTRFQLVSTAFTVTEKLEPAVWAVGVPVLPEPEPGAAVSPGISSWSFVAAPTFTTTLALVPVLPETLVAVNVPVVAIPV